MGYKYRKAIQFGHLRLALAKCCRNVRWKPSVTGYEHNAQKNTYALAESLKNGWYKIKIKGKVGYVREDLVGWAAYYAD